MSDDIMEEASRSERRLRAFWDTPVVDQPGAIAAAADSIADLRAEIVRLRAALTPCAETKAADALQALDDALCNYANWVNDFSELADPDHQRVFDALCAAYNGWHNARRSAAKGQATKETGA